MRGSVYVHFPYCLAKCPYCDFVSYKAAPAAIDHEGYADAVLRELEARRAPFLAALAAKGGEPRIGSIFFGGGTPSLWEPRSLGRVLAALRRTLPATDDVEVTVECNPTSLDEARARMLQGEGVNRLSIGTQSLDADELRFLGRLHDPDGALRAIEGALRVADLRVSADLIFGLHGQPADAAPKQAARLCELGLSHVSAYQLTIEAGTQFGELARRGRLPLADDGRVAEAFLALDEAMTARGFRHYEISNYARPGQEARHNLGYWRGEPYLGLGCAAFGAYGGARRRNPTDPARYVAFTRELADAGASADDELVEPLDGATLLRERIMLGLRLECGFDLEEAANAVGEVAWTDERRRAADWLAARERLNVRGNHLAIPRHAWLFADDTAARLF